MPGALRALDVSFVAAPSGAQLRSTVGYPPDITTSADPIEDVSAWLLRLGGAVKQTVLDWIHWPLPYGVNEERHDFLSSAEPAGARLPHHHRRGVGGVGGVGSVGRGSVCSDGALHARREWRP
mmetsp:Transcript_54101/g.118429  ORF Transcript_54101/g.118429 Transcript_54101/m.118429 type:complete len:123 (+) Transcript_54101:47-415(+)